MVAIELRRSRAYLAWAAVAFIAIAAGCGGSGDGNGGPAPDTTPPQVTASVSPDSFRVVGQVTITAVATDNAAVKTVTAAVTRLGTDTVLVQLTGSGTYSATYRPPPNVGSEYQVYQVIVTAIDTSGNSASSALLSFTVRPDRPEEPPDLN